MVISHNLPALNAYNKLGANVTGLAKSSEKLSSGFRINRAGDDAAGLAISEKMRSQLRGLKQSVRNAQDGISYIQTAEGALGSIHDILQRCKELAAESANGSYDNPTDRAALQLEYRQLCDEVDHISLTDFNGISIFDTTGASAPDAFGNSAELKVGERGDSAAAGLGETRVKVTLEDGSDINFSVCFNGFSDIEAVQTANVNNYSNWASQLTFGGTRVSEAAIRIFAQSIQNTYLPKLVGSIVAALPNSSKPTVNGMGIGFELYNGGANGTLAYVSSNGTSFTLAINTNYLTVTNGAINFSDDLAGTVAHEMTHAIMFDTITNGMLAIDPTTGSQNSNDPKLMLPHWFKEGMAETVGGAMDRLIDIMGKNNVDVSEVEKLNPNTKYSNNVSISQIQTWMNSMKSYSTTGSTANVGYSRGYAACMYLGYKAGGGKNLSTDVNSTLIAKGLDNILTDLAAGHSLDSVIAHYTDRSSTSDFVNNINSTEVAQFVEQLIKSANVKLETKSTGGGSFSINVPAAGSVISPNGLAGSNGSLLNGTSTNSYFTLDIENDSYDNTGKFTGAGIGSGGIYEGGTTSVGGKDRDGNSVTGFAGDTNTGGTGGTGGTDPTDPTDPSKPGTGGTDPDDPNKPGGTGGTGGTGGNDPTKPGGTGGTGGNDPTKPDGTGGAITKGSSKSLTLQLGPRSKDAVRFTFSYRSDGIGRLNNDLCCTAQGLGLDMLSVSGQDNANAAIDGIDHAINKVSCIRATFGSVQNRLEHKITNLTNVHENITEAESQIRDTDMASEMMNYTRYQILQNAAQTMLSQANQSPQGILSLLG